MAELSFEARQSGSGPTCLESKYIVAYLKIPSMVLLPWHAVDQEVHGSSSGHTGM